MTGKSVTIIEYNRAFDPLLETFARWLSCNGEMWGVGPTAVFASAALVFLYHELESSLNVPGDVPSVCCLERTLLLTMVLGMLALMTHLWVCSMRFLQCYLDTLIKDSPSILLEMTTVSLLGGHNDLIQLGPLTRFLRQQQPQIHMTICWFLALCYADFVRKNYCRSFNMPYLEQWQSDIHDRAMRGYRVAMDKLNEFICCVNTRLRGYTNATVLAALLAPTVGAAPPQQTPTTCLLMDLQMRCKNCEVTSRRRGVLAVAVQLLLRHLQPQQHFSQTLPVLSNRQTSRPINNKYLNINVLV